MANQTRMAKLQELIGIFAKVNGCSAVVATNVIPPRNCGCFATRAQLSSPDTSTEATKR
jgi:hypothetical protein